MLILDIEEYLRRKNEKSEVTSIAMNIPEKQNKECRIINMIEWAKDKLRNT